MEGLTESNDNNLYPHRHHTCHLPTEWVFWSIQILLNYYIMPCNIYWQNSNFEVRWATFESWFCTFVLPGLGISFRSCLHVTVPHCLILNSQASKIHSFSVHFRCASELKYFQSQETHHRTSLVVQWLRHHLPMQGVWVWALIGELRSHMTHGQKKTTEHRQQK